jgi:hypothetical protein
MQEECSIAHLRWPHEPQPPTGEMARLSLLSSAWDDMAANIGFPVKPEFELARDRFAAILNSTKGD